MRTHVYQKNKTKKHKGRWEGVTNTKGFMGTHAGIQKKKKNTPVSPPNPTTKLRLCADHKPRHLTLPSFQAVRWAGGRMERPTNDWRRNRHAASTARRFMPREHADSYMKEIQSTQRETKHKQEASARGGRVQRTNDRIRGSRYILRGLTQWSVPFVILTSSSLNVFTIV